MKKKLLLGLSALALAGVGTLAIKSPVVAYAEGEEPLTSEVEEVEQSVEESPISEEQSVSETIHIYTEEELKELLEGYYNANIRDQYMFGIELGAIIGFCTSLLGIAYSIYKTRKTAKKNEMASENVDRLEKRVEELNAIVNDYKDSNKDMTAEFKSLVSDTYSQLKITLEELRDIAKKLPEYEDLNVKLDKIGEAIKESSSTLENVANGTAEKVANIIDEVK